MNTQTKLSDWYKPANKNIIVTLWDGVVSLGNGVRVQEERGKKDIVCGIVELAENIPEQSLVYFPMFAASPIKIITHNDGLDATKNYYAVNFEDIILVSKQ